MRDGSHSSVRCAIGEVVMNVRVVITMLVSQTLAQGALATAPAPRECDSASARELLTCLRHCSGRDNDASTRVCKQRCMEKNDARKEQCAKAKQPRLIIL
jgi:hypothetical protein